MIEKNKLKCLAPYLGLFLIYLVVHSFLLLNKSFYWDDWIWMLNPKELKIALDELGFVFFKDFYASFAFWPIFYVKLLIFFCYFFSGVFFYKILKSFHFISPDNSFYVSALYLVAPFNIFGRANVCTASYGVSLFFFFAGLYLYLKYRFSNKRLWLLPALVSVTFSFNTTSILVIYIAALIALEFAIGCVQDRNRREHMKYIFIIAAVGFVHTLTFYLVKTIYFAPHGVYANYNQANVSLVIVRTTFKYAAQMFFEPLAFAVIGKDLLRERFLYLRWVFIALFYLPFAWACLFRKHSIMWASLLGVALTIAALFPYMAVSKTPTSFSWDSRFQLLIPIGVTIWFLAIFMVIQSEKVRKIVFVLLLGVFSFASIRMYLSLQGLSYQEQSLQAEIRRVFNNQPGSYVLTDRGYPPGIMDHDWNFYEFSGMIYKNKGTQQDFLILASHMGTLSLAGIPESFGNYKERYMVSNVKWAAPYYCLKLNELVHMDEWNSFSMLIGELTGEKHINERIEKIYRLDKYRAEMQGMSAIKCYFNQT